MVYKTHNIGGSSLAVDLLRAELTELVCYVIYLL